MHFPLLLQGIHILATGLVPCTAGTAYTSRYFHARSVIFLMTDRQTDSLLSLLGNASLMKEAGTYTDIQHTVYMCTGHTFIYIIEFTSATVIWTR